MDISALIVGSSFVLQLVSAGLSVRLVLLTGKRAAGMVIFATIALMALRRFISLYRLITGGELKIDLFAEVIALIISFMILVGILYITRLLVSQDEATSKLKESEKFLKAVIHTEPECVKLLGPDGNLLMMNNAGLEMIEADSFEEVKGEVLYHLLDPEHQESFRGITEKVFQGESATLEFGMKGIKGRRLRLETHAVPLYNEENKVIALLGITRNITDKKRLEEEKEKLIFELREALANVKILKGFLPICASCKKIRDDRGYWNQIESYISKHSEAEFSHSICPDCAKKMYPEL